MIATKLAVLMAATILAAGVSIAPFFLGAEAESINTTRSNIKGSAIGQQNADQSCINQAQGQGGQQAVPNTEQTTTADRADPIPGLEVRLAEAGISSEGDPTVNAEQSNECSIAMEQTVEQNGDTEDFSTNEWIE